MHKKIYSHFMKDSLYRNSIYLMLSTGIMAFFGFFFWIINARLYKPEQVGIATTLISVMTLISTFSLLGFNVGLIKYLPKSTKHNEKINSSLILIVLAGVIASVVFIYFLKLFSPQLLFLQSNFLFMATFVIFIIGSSLNTVVESIFVAYRASSNILIKNTLLSILKVIFPIFFVFLGSYGIFSSVAVATLISCLVSFIILIIKFNYRPSLMFKVSDVKEMAAFSGGNYIAGFFTQTPALILPILIINTLNAKIAAYYYIDTMILGFLAIIPIAVTQSLFAEGSHDTSDLKKHFIKAVKIIYFLLIPAILLIVLFGNIILNFFGKSYADESFIFLRIIGISAIFMPISSLGNSLLKIRHQIKELIITNILSAIFVLGFSILFIQFGLAGIGWGWLVGQVIVACLYIFVLGRKRLFSRRTYISLIKYLSAKFAIKS